MVSPCPGPRHFLSGTLIGAWRDHPKAIRVLKDPHPDAADRQWRDGLHDWPDGEPSLAVADRVIPQTPGLVRQAFLVPYRIPYANGSVRF
jgi:hypothetical protein